MANGFKTGGRQKGTPNKVTGTIKEILSRSIRKELEYLPVLLKTLEPKDRIDVMLKLMVYIVPKASSENDDPLKPKQDKSDFFSNILLQIANRTSENSQT